MPEFNDRRLRVKRRVSANGIQPGDHYVHPVTSEAIPVSHVGQGLMETATGVSPGTKVAFNNGGTATFANRSRHSILRIPGE